MNPLSKNLSRKGQFLPGLELSIYHTWHTA